MQNLNSSSLFVKQAEIHSRKIALWLPGKFAAVTFGEMLTLSSQAQNLALRNGISSGQTVLVADFLSARLYATIIGLIGLGVTVILVEPWMPVSRIEHVIQLVKPKLFLTNWFGKLWGLRVKSIRSIPRWVNIDQVYQTPNQKFITEMVSPETPGIITFTSGTTGAPKGVVRNQGYLIHQHEILSDNLELGKFTEPDLCIFANFALANLASGRGSLFVPTEWWHPLHLKYLDELPATLQPVSVTCGPGVLRSLMRHTKLKSLKSIHVGGALTDCNILEEGFRVWPDSHWLHVYGSSEAEPVALADARMAVKNSREKGYFQTLCLGNPVKQINHQMKADSVWVSGPHVCPKYVGNEQENEVNKYTDESGIIWHCMGDRVSTDENNQWWYSGRSGQDPEVFKLEQKLYTDLQTSAGFLEKVNGELIAYFQNAKERAERIYKSVPEITNVYDIKIKRDSRHRARIDRKASLKTKRRSY